MRIIFDLVIHGGTCVTPEGRKRLNIGVRNGRIATLGEAHATQAAVALDATALHVLPGVIDSHVHFREPGLTHKEDIGSGSAAAALGGVTAFFEMPNTQPNTDSEARLAWKLLRAQENSWIDYAFLIAATNDNASQSGLLERLPGCAGVKMFLGSSTGSLLVSELEIQRQVLLSGRRRLACHSEDELRLRDRKPLFTGRGVDAHPEWRDVQCATQATCHILQLARQTHRLLHILHVTSAEELDWLQRFRDIATVEVTPQHLTFAAPDCYELLGTKAQMNPPIRELCHREAIWKALRNGFVDCIGSDHAPHTLEEKAKPWPDSPSGMPGVQTLVPIMLNHVHDGQLTLERFVELTSAGPARVYRIQRKGAIALGYDADFTIVDLAARRTITNDSLNSRCGWTPFHQFKVVGWPLATVVRGHLVMRNGELFGSPQGNAVSFDSLTPEAS